MIDIKKIIPGVTQLRLIRDINEPGICIGDIFDVEAISTNPVQSPQSLIYVNFKGKSMGGFFPSFFEILEASHDGFKLGKYHAHFGIVDAVATYKNMVWCVTNNGTMISVSRKTLKPIAKFDHLRGLAIDTKVIVWGNPDGIKANRHFSHVSECGNLVYCFNDGATSFTSTKTLGWDNCEVWEESK